jgi:cytochrome P450
MSLAIAEFLRYLSPLPKMERAPEAVAALPQSEQNPESDYVWLSFVSGNHDPAVFANPGTIDIRRPRTANLVFGAGPHTCIGNHVAEVEAKLFLAEFLSQVPNWEVDRRSDLRFLDIGSSRYLAHVGSLYLQLES